MIILSIILIYSLKYLTISFTFQIIPTPIFVSQITLYINKILTSNLADLIKISLFLVPGAQVLRSPARKMVLLGGARDILAAISAPERRHRDIPGQPK